MKHLLGIADLSRAEIADLLARTHTYAQALAQGRDLSSELQGKIILHLFFEDSTRTLTSFEIAAKRMGAQVVNWNPHTSSLSKGESFIDTIDTLGAMGADAIVMRSSEYGAPVTLSKRVNCPVINGGDSWREHPTQALLDAYTMSHALKRDFSDMTVVIVGDIAHSRVAASNILLLGKLGARVRVVAPPTLLPEKIPTVEGAPAVEKFTELEDGLKGVDIVMTLRLQKERMDRGLIPSPEMYFERYGLTTDLLDRLCPRAKIMDPGPLVRGMQMEDDVAEDPQRSLILTQVANGIPTRMAVLASLIHAAS
jgi:aspartate carbamoyltransferase catalytic subunit